MRIAPLLAGVLALSPLLAACGGDDEPVAPAAAPTSPVSSPSSAPSPSPSPVGARVRLTGDGIDAPNRVVAFGATFEEVEPVLKAALGEPTRDTGEQESFGTYGTCPGSRLRALEYGGGAFYVLFGDAIGPGMTMYQWSLTEQGRPDEVPRASALVGDVATFEFGVGDTLGELREGIGDEQLEVQPGDEIVPTTVRVMDQSSGFLGYLPGTGDDAALTRVLAGEPCGE